MGWFKEHFSIHEGRISNLVRDPRFLREPPSSVWCALFSFGFDEPPITDYRVLLHDLRNHFPKLVFKLKEFEKVMKKLCPLYDKKMYELVKVVLSLTSSISEDIGIRSVLNDYRNLTLK